MTGPDGAAEAGHAADPAGAADETLLLGAVSLDRYLPSGELLPGGGVLNMAWHWRSFGRPFRLLTRIGEVDGGLAREAIGRLGIVADTADLARPGESAMIDIEILPDRQPFMDNFRPGVWDEYRLSDGELAILGRARRLHAVLVEGAIAELERLAGLGRLGHLEVSADFLGFRHYTVERLARTMGHVDIGFIGWPGDADAPEVGGMRDIAFDLRRLLVVTMGARSIHVFDGRAEPGEHRFAVRPVPVEGTTLGCGDAFIAWFLDELWRSGDLERAVDRGRSGGALATRWRRPLPDDAYATTSAIPADAPTARTTP